MDNLLIQLKKQTIIIEMMETAILLSCMANNISALRLRPKKLNSIILDKQIKLGNQDDMSSINMDNE